MRLKPQEDADLLFYKASMLEEENKKLRAAWELCEEAAFMLLRTGGFRQVDRDRALAMLDRARAESSLK